MDSLSQPDKYGATKKSDTTTNGYYFIKFISEAYTLQNNTTIDGKVINAGELVVKAQYILSMKDNSDWYWEKHPLQHTIILPTHTILHPRLDVVVIKYAQDTPKSVCNRIQ